MKKVLICGAGGFIGTHLTRYLRGKGSFVVGVDLKLPEFGETAANEFHLADLRDPRYCSSIFQTEFDEIYQLAADMGGAGYIFTGAHDADIVSNSMQINLNVLRCCCNFPKAKIFFSSSACIYPKYNQEDPFNPKCTETEAYPASPDSEYGWEKLMSERLYASYARNYGLNVRIARFHNVFGPEGTWQGGKEKAPAAICRKICKVEDNEFIEIWGDGEQTRSFLYIDECLEGIARLMASDYTWPLNIGSDQMVSVNKLVHIVSGIAGKKINIRHVPGPIGVKARTSDNSLINQVLGWRPTLPLEEGLFKTYNWVSSQIEKQICNTEI
jgi:GDP-D-mannose 3',5'-epimerase